MPSVGRWPLLLRMRKRGITAGQSFNDLARLEEAIADFDTAISLQADFAGSILQQGEVFFLLLGRSAEASVVFDTALLVKPELAESSVPASPHASAPWAAAKQAPIRPLPLPKRGSHAAMSFTTGASRRPGARRL